MFKPFKTYLVPLALLLFGLLVSFYPNFDPDFWWHLRTGQEIVTTGQIPQVDTYSFSMPDYPYIYHTWLSEVFIYLIYQTAGHTGITLFYSVAVVSGIILLTYKKAQLLPTVVGLILLQPILVVTGLRTQAVSFLGLSLVFYLIDKMDNQQKSLKINRDNLIILTGLFLIWANLHPGFILGLAILVSYIIYRLVQLKRLPISQFRQAGLIIALPTLATLINPYGFSLHQFILAMSQNSTAAAFNQDWLGYFSNPIISTSHKFLVIAWCGGALWASKGFRRLLIVGLLAATFYSTRFAMPLMVALIWSMPATYTYLNQKFQPLRYFSAKQLVVSWGLLLLFGLRQYPQIPATLLAHSNNQIHSHASQPYYNYPYAAVQTLKDLPKKNIFNYYDWGGYLIYHLPDKKIFIDGRMDNFYLPNQISFMTIYQDIVDLQPGWENSFNSYQIDYVLLPPQEPLVQILSQQNWQVIYQDDISILLQK